MCHNLEGGGGSPIFSKGVLVYDTQFKTGEIPKAIFLVSGGLLVFDPDSKNGEVPYLTGVVTHYGEGFFVVDPESKLVTLADLRGASRTPPGSDLFHFHADFREKFTKIIGWHPHLCGWRPLL